MTTYTQKRFAEWCEDHKEAKDDILRYCDAPNIEYLFDGRTAENRYYSFETIRANAYDVTLANGAKHRCIDPDALLDIEPADVRENVMGTWKVYCDDKGVVEDCYCDQCGFNSVIGGNYCPNCGAEMRGES